MKTLAGACPCPVSQCAVLQNGRLIGSDIIATYGLLAVRIGYGLICFHVMIHNKVTKPGLLLFSLCIIVFLILYQVRRKTLTQYVRVLGLSQEQSDFTVILSVSSFQVPDVVYSERSSV